MFQVLFPRHLYLWKPVTSSLCKNLMLNSLQSIPVFSNLIVILLLQVSDLFPIEDTSLHAARCSINSSPMALLWFYQGTWFALHA